ncbi:DUF7093 family protein [Halorussus ruber]|uniref:DUF7093 family protein n=1 Tax=Halorussus ruber TaxID=1126238 RepID=UPI0010920448|nr:hypothetical protein [Halorussus ruber]
MSLRCSLLGHSYGEAEIEREREEQGSEVVVTVREFEECERCGDRKVVTENKEVTAIQSPAPDLESAESDVAGDQSSGSAANSPASNASGAGGASDASGGRAAGGANASGPNASDGRTTGGPAAGTGRASSSPSSHPDVQMGADADAAGDDAEIIDDSPSSSDSSGSAEQSARSEASEANTSSGGSGASRSGASNTSSASGGSDTSSTAEGDFEQGPSAADDDGVILDDDGDSGSSASDGDRTPGEWPDADTTHPAETDDSPREWPSVGREDDEGFDAGPANSESADVDFGGGLTPESAPEVDDDESEEVEFVNAEGDALRSQDTGASGADFSSGISAGADAPSLSGPSKDPDVDAEFVCPECDYREAVSGSSLRAGDICPDCSRGYIAQE